MNFSEALAFLKAGERLVRDNWDPYARYVVLQKGYPHGISINKNTAEATGLPEGEVCIFHPYLMLGVANGGSPSGTSFVPWQPTVTDLLAEDWKVV